MVGAFLLVELRFDLLADDHGINVGCGGALVRICVNSVALKSLHRVCGVEIKFDTGQKYQTPLLSVNS